MRLVATACLLIAMGSIGAWASRPSPDPSTTAASDATRPAHRVASASLTADEILLALLPPHRIVALGAFSDDPAVSHVADRARVIAGRVRRDPESVLPLAPDALFVDPFGLLASRPLLNRLRVPLIELPPVHSFEDVERCIRLVGAAVGRERQAEGLVETMQRRLDAVARRVHGRPRPRVLLLGPGGYTAGAGTLFDEQLRRAAGHNLAVEAGLRGHARIAPERALALDPEVILYTEYRADALARPVEPRPALADDPLWAGTRAARHGRLVRVEPRELMTTSHHAVALVESLERVLHGPSAVSH
ncbi:MAG: ABC transporter substrate-binding protein [Myxococcota bacterium]|nr:ABC transporter substrate-binding protein [Myxococcota bacterium]MDW8360931.1 ABC transporter substrate-binding protein [Myxococcales bacterium]